MRSPIRQTSDGVAVLDVGEVAAELDRAGVDRRHVGRMAVDAWRPRAGGRRSAADVAAVQGRADQLAVRATVGERLHVVGVEEAVALRLGERDEIGDGERHAADAEDVGAEVGDLLLDIEIRALHQRHHRDQRGDPHRQAEDRQRCAQLVRADGVHRQNDIVPEAHHTT